MRRRCKISVEITNGIKACGRYATYPANTRMRRFVPTARVLGGRYFLPIFDLDEVVTLNVVTLYPRTLAGRIKALPVCIR